VVLVSNFFVVVQVDAALGVREALDSDVDAFYYFDED
jgi:hypothetical protein